MTERDMRPTDIGGGRIVLWDGRLVDEALTDASLKINQPVLKRELFTLDGDDETAGVSYPCIVSDGKGYKLYYMPWTKDSDGSLRVLESDDGLTWRKPALDIFDRPEMKTNNVVMEHRPDGVFVFYDTNPKCPEGERYKAIGKAAEKDASGKTVKGLYCYHSPDGYRFTLSHLLTVKGFFDSLNTANWKNGRYSCYFRNFHDIPDEAMRDGITDINAIHNGEYYTVKYYRGVRDVRVMFSEDFKNWTEPERISFNDGKDYPLYTNNVTDYPRCGDVVVGFPVRYCEREAWTKNVEQMASAAVKKRAMETVEKRMGLALTDCIFMHSYDGSRFFRSNEAFVTPGYENDHNWVYGDCYLAYGMIDSGRETYYLYAFDGNVRDHKRTLELFEIRKDGFACYHAGGDEKTLVTKPVVFKGSGLSLNFSTSAYGYIYVDVLDADGIPLSQSPGVEIYGNSIDRRAYFEDGSDFAAFEGKAVRLRFRMRDASLYSFRFVQ